MPESLRVKIKNLHYKGIFNTSQKERLLNALNKAERTGKWIKHENPNLGKCMQVSWECTACGVWMGCQYFVRKSYCPNCGIKMEEVQESEDKE